MWAWSSLSLAPRRNPVMPRLAWTEGLPASFCPYSLVAFCAIGRDVTESTKKKYQRKLVEWDKTVNMNNITDQFADHLVVYRLAYHRGQCSLYNNNALKIHPRLCQIDPQQKQQNMPRYPRLPIPPMAHNFSMANASIRSWKLHWTFVVPLHGHIVEYILLI